MLGFIVRMYPVMATDFPLNDGGLFYLMAQEIQRANYGLPEFTSYNAAGIPFAYPPLGFYIAAFLSDITNSMLLDVIRLMPGVLSALVVPAVYLLSRSLLQSWMQASIAAAAFAMFPVSFTWYIMGGGLTRAAGVLFAVLALHQAYLLYTRQRSEFILSTIFFSSLTVLSHPEVLWFLGFSLILFYLLLRRDRQGLINSVLVSTGVLLATAPWWATVISRHGIAPIVAASQTGSHSLEFLSKLITFNFTGEPFSGLLAVMGLLGVFVCIADRKPLLPLWLVAILILSPRSGSMYAMVPLSMLVALGLDRLILPALGSLGRSRNISSNQERADEANASVPQWMTSGSPRILLAYIFVYALISALVTPVVSKSLNQVTPDERQSMQWVATNTLPTSKFILLTTRLPWEDGVSEWFPVLAQRVSLGTYQGSEWLPNHFSESLQHALLLQECSSSRVECLARWGESPDHAFTHVYLRKLQGNGQDACCPLLEQSLLASPEYTLLYDGPGAVIFARRVMGAAR
jgi:hypothetical protein